MKLLVVDDERRIAESIKQGLEQEGYAVDVAFDGEDGYNAAWADEYDAIILDVMMPRKDGFTLARDIRAINTMVPIIFLTAKTEKGDVLHGFEVGADDYVTKPFSLDELLARIEAILRRVKGVESKIMPYYQLGKFFFDIQKQTLTIGEKVIKLTTKESQLLSLLCSFANETLERNYALKTIWENDNYFNARSMDVYITKLRKILKEDPSLEIKNVHGKGYRLNTTLGDGVPEDLVTKI